MAFVASISLAVRRSLLDSLGAVLVGGSSLTASYYLRLPPDPTGTALNAVRARTIAAQTSDARIRVARTTLLDWTHVSPGTGRQ